MNYPPTPRTFAKSLFALMLCAPLLAGCPPGPEHPVVTRPPRAQKWFERAQLEYRSAQLDQAHDSARQALDLVPKDEQVRLLAARVALGRLEFDEVLRLLAGVETSPSLALRGRAHWYKGDIHKAADELEKLLRDPEVNDRWAKSINKLARRGVGRKPFDIEIDEGRLVAVQMARVAEQAPYYIVPLEIDGEEALALVATGQSEVTIDSTTRREPSWVSLRFGHKFEVRDVPALTQDLTELSTRLRAPIRVLLGANLLRHINATIDFRGRQFVARSFVPPPPPVASSVNLFYLRGGGMVLGGSFGADSGERASFFVDSAMHQNVMLDVGGWRKIGIDANTLKPSQRPQDGAMPGGMIPLMRLGAFKLPQVPAVFGKGLARVEKELDVDIDGALGAGLLADFRLTFSDRGRVLWVEKKERLIAPPSYDPSQPLAPPNSGPSNDTAPIGDFGGKQPTFIAPDSPKGAPEAPSSP